MRVRFGKSEPHFWVRGVGPFRETVPDFFKLALNHALGIGRMCVSLHA